jgi:hypothetical protein
LPLPGSFDDSALVGGQTTPDAESLIEAGFEAFIFDRTDPTHPHSLLNALTLVGEPEIGIEAAAGG